MTANEREQVRMARDQHVRAALDRTPERLRRLNGAIAAGSPVDREAQRQLVQRMIQRPGHVPKVGRDGRVWLVKP